MALRPTGELKTPAPIKEPVFPVEPVEEYEPLNAHVTESDWPDLSEDGEEPLWRIGPGEFLDTPDPYEWKQAVRGV